ncbi:hypothetical protein MJH12_01310 [bacterium]|nr:hypothetical protein [bacterium]
MKLQTIIFLLSLATSFSSNTMDKKEHLEKQQSQFEEIFGLNTSRSIKEYLIKSVYKNNQTQLEVPRLKVLQKNSHQISLDADLSWINIANFGFHNTQEDRTQIVIHLDPKSEKPISWSIVVNGVFSFLYPKDQHPIPPRYKGDAWADNDLQDLEYPNLKSFLLNSVSKKNHSVLEIVSFVKLENQDEKVLRFSTDLSWVDIGHYGYHNTKEQGAIIEFVLNDKKQAVSWSIQTGNLSYLYPNEEHPVPPRNEKEIWLKN